MQILSRSLRRHERGAYSNHLLRLSAVDRRLRFGVALDDDAIRDHVARIDLARDAVFGVFDDELALVGAAHVARGTGYAEIGVSVLPGHRARGVGNALIERSRLRAQNWGVAELFIHCASDNTAMLRLAQRHGMRAVHEGGEADAYAPVPAPDAASFTAELIAEQIAAADCAIKAQCLQARRLASALQLRRAAA